MQSSGTKETLKSDIAVTSSMHVPLKGPQITQN